MSRANDMVYPLDHSVNIAPNGTTQCGLTIREHFAAMAMQGFISSGLEMKENSLASPPQGRTIDAWLAAEAVAYADALIAELAKPVTP